MQYQNLVDFVDNPTSTTNVIGQVTVQTIADMLALDNGSVNLASGSQIVVENDPTLGKATTYILLRNSKALAHTGVVPAPNGGNFVARATV